MLTLGLTATVAWSVFATLVSGSHLLAQVTNFKHGDLNSPKWAVHMPNVRLQEHGKGFLSFV